ncbi:hypothetical protein P7C70_g1865, partial [Phenoliferia sp. Uapishka_3]
MPTGLLDLADELLEAICEATTMDSNSVENTHFSRPTQDLFNLAQVNRRLGRIAERPLWQFVDMESTDDIWDKFRLWRTRKLAATPRLWTLILGMKLVINTIPAGTQFASLVLTLATNLQYLRFEFDDTTSDEFPRLLDTSITNSLRRLPLKMLSLVKAGAGVEVGGFVDSTFDVLLDLPVLQHVELSGAQLASQFVNVKRKPLARCRFVGDGLYAGKALIGGVHLFKSVELKSSSGIGEYQSLWSTYLLDKLERTWPDLSPPSRRQLTADESAIFASAAAGNCLLTLDLDLTSLPLPIIHCLPAALSEQGTARSSAALESRARTENRTRRVSRYFADMPTNLLDLPDELLETICEATTMDKDSVEHTHFSRPIQHLFALAQVNRRLRRISEPALWQFIDMEHTSETNNKYCLWRVRKLSATPQLWSLIHGMKLVTNMTTAGTQFASLILSLAKQLQYLRFAFDEPESTNHTGILDVCITNQLRKLPLKMISLVTAGAGAGMEVSGFGDDTFALLRDLPLLQHVELSGRKLSSSLIACEPVPFDRCVFIGNAQVAKALCYGVRLFTSIELRQSPGSRDYHNIWLAKFLDLLDHNWQDVSPTLSAYAQQELTIIYLFIQRNDSEGPNWPPFCTKRLIIDHPIFIGGELAMVPRIFQLLGRVGLNDLRVVGCGAFTWASEWSTGTSLPTVNLLSVEATIDPWDVEDDDVGNPERDPQRGRFLEKVRTLLPNFSGKADLTTSLHLAGKARGFTAIPQMLPQPIDSSLAYLDCKLRLFGSRRVNTRPDHGSPTTPSLTFDDTGFDQSRTTSVMP